MISICVLIATNATALVLHNGDTGWVSTEFLNKQVILK